MCVCLAAQSTAAALEPSVKLGLLPREALTTAWFVRAVNDWFDAMNARKSTDAVHNTPTAASVSLQIMSDVIRRISFSGRKVWKPIQTGIQLSTNVVLRLGEQLMLKYFLSGRLSQGPVENLFSQARGQGVVHPSCTSFRLALWLITVAQYLEVSKGAAYADDGCTYMVNYLKEHCQTLHFSDDTSLGEVDEPELCQVASDAARLSVVESDFCHPLNLESRQ